LVLDCINIIPFQAKPVQRFVLGPEDTVIQAFIRNTISNIRDIPNVTFACAMTATFAPEANELVAFGLPKVRLESSIEACKQILDQHE
jgi:hypothetical protein